MAQGDQQITDSFATMAAADKQTLTFSTVNGSGAPQTTKVDLTGVTSASTAATAINTALQQTNNPSLTGIVATASGDGTSITFSSASNNQFSVTFGASSAAGVGLGNQNTIQTSQTVGMNNTGDISTQAGAAAAVTALANAVVALGNAQAAVGKGENNFNYAVNLAQSQVTNLAASESTIRDADLASEAANLSKAQILVQAGTAALSQANSAPQSILKLLQ
jgi:flagellin